MSLGFRYVRYMVLAVRLINLVWELDGPDKILRSDS